MSTAKCTLYIQYALLLFLCQSMPIITAAILGARNGNLYRRPPLYTSNVLKIQWMPIFFSVIQIQGTQLALYLSASSSHSLYLMIIIRRRGTYQQTNETKTRWNEMRAPLNEFRPVTSISNNLIRHTIMIYETKPLICTQLEAWIMKRNKIFHLSAIVYFLLLLEYILQKHRCVDGVGIWVYAMHKWNCNLYLSLLH